MLTPLLRLWSLRHPFVGLQVLFQVALLVVNEAAVHDGGLHGLPSQWTHRHRRARGHYLHCPQCPQVQPKITHPVRIRTPLWGVQVCLSVQTDSLSLW